MRLLELRYTSADLAASPRGHRIAFLGLAQIANEASLLLRMSIAAVNSMSGSQPERDRAQSAALFSLRMLAGRIFEARLFIDTKEVSSTFEDLREWISLAHPHQSPRMEEARTGRAALAAVLTKGGIIRRLRHESIFHVDPQLIEASFQRTPEDMDLLDYHAADMGNTSFGAADTLHLTAFAHILSEDNVQAALDETLATINSAVGHLTDFVSGVALAYSLRYLGLRPGMPSAEVGADTLGDIRLPLFIQAEPTA